ncbi:hypothetical protein BGZ65_010693, partial [Modicella reniformis]
MDVYALTKKQRPTHLTRGELNKTVNSAMAPSADQQQQRQQQQPQQSPSPQHRQQQQQQQHSVLGAPPTLQDIESRHSQLPPQYLQAVLEKKQKEHQQRLLQYQQSQQQQQQQQQGSVKSEVQRLPQSGLTTTLNGMTNESYGGMVKESTNNNNNNNTSHQRIIVAAPLMSTLRSDRHLSTFTSNMTSGPNRAHWK